jgi:Fe-S oxidoreductase
LGALGVDLVGIDPSMTLTYRSEYVEALADGRAPKVMLIQEWLAKRCRATGNALGGTYFLLPHCTERTTAAAALRDWQAAFELVGLGLQILPSGCCGMAGTWGHEAKHRELSEHIYALSWRRPVLSSDSGRLLADGYSCRSQVKLVDKISLRHPASAMLDQLRQRATANSVRSKEPSL